MLFARWVGKLRMRLYAGNKCSFAGLIFEDLSVFWLFLFFYLFWWLLFISYVIRMLKSNPREIPYILFLKSNEIHSWCAKDIQYYSAVFCCISFLLRYREWSSYSEVASGEQSVRRAISRHCWEDSVLHNHYHDICFVHKIVHGFGNSQKLPSWIHMLR